MRGDDNTRAGKEAACADFCTNQCVIIIIIISKCAKIVVDLCTSTLFFFSGNIWNGE